MSGLVLGACAALTAAAFLGAGPAQAATANWRQVYQQHYGPARDYSIYNAVVATGKNSAWALGGSDESGGNGTVQRPEAVHWNGKAWRGYAFPARVTSFIMAASAPAASDIWAVTFSGGWVLHWNGSRWLVARQLPGTGELTGVTALSPKNVWVFGGGGETGGLGTWHYNGKTWQEWKSGNAAGLETASAVSAANIWAIGGTLAPYSAIMHFNGRTWQQASAAVFSGLQFTGISALSGRNVWASAFKPGSNGFSGLLLHYNGAKWARVWAPWKVWLGQPVPDGHGGLWMRSFSGILTQQNYLVHRSAAGKWSRTAVSWTPLALTQIPGTASLGAVGWKTAGAGGKAVIWAYGAV